MATQQTTGHLHLASHRLPILALTGREALNRPCYLKVTCPTPLPLPGTDLLNQPASVELQLIDGRSRWFHLQVQQLNLISDGNDRAELRLASKLHQGTLQPRTRLMMDQTREQVLKHLLASMGYQPQEIDLVLEPGPAPDGPFLQAQETNLQCLQRLLAEIGANYWFEHPAGQDHETLVIRNNPDITPYLPDIEWASAVSGLAPGDALNRITDAKGHWRWQPSRIARSVSEAHRGTGNASHTGLTELTLDQANHQTFDPPLGLDAAEARALYQQQRRDATRYTLSISSHQPLLTAGYCLPLDARSLPTGTLGGGTRGDFRILTVEHTAEADGAGLAYRNSATLMPRNDPVRPELIKPPALPPLFPARIESRYDHAELGSDGRYYFRLDADEAFGARQPYDAATHAQASPLTERLAPYASPEQEGITTGWHFPLLNRTTVLVTCLNNDPARAMILGVIPSRHQIGPVTRDNAQQSRLVTPGQNELRFDDSLDAEAIALHSFDQQTLLALNAAGTEHYIKLATQFGGLSIRAGKTLNLTTDTGNLDERIGGDRSQRVKQHSHSQIDGHQRHQADAEHHHLAQFHLTQAAEGDISLWVQERSLTRRIRSGDRTTEIQHGDYQIQVSDGALVHQVNGDITIEGNGGGDLVLIKGDTGVKIDPAGNIKLFGKKITLHGTQSGVTFNGEVSYEIGGGNEAEDVEALERVEIAETMPLVTESTPLFIDVAWQEKTAKPGRPAGLMLSYQGMEEGSQFLIDVELVHPDGTGEVYTSVELPVTTSRGVKTHSLVLPKQPGEAAKKLDDVTVKNPYTARFKVSCDGVESQWSEPAVLLMDLQLRVNTQADLPARDRTPVFLETSDERVHRAYTQQGRVQFTDVLSGPYRVWIDQHHHKQGPQ